MQKQRCSDANCYRLNGYVNAVGRESKLISDPITGGTFTEIISPGTFKKSLAQNPITEITVDVNHNLRQRTPPVPLLTKKIDLYEDSIGLYADVLVDKEDFDRQTDVNSLQGWSFDFIPNAETLEWGYNLKGIPCRVVNDLTLKGISIIGANYDGQACYAGTSIASRGSGGNTCWTRAGNVFGQIKSKKVFFTSDDMKKVYSEREPTIGTSSSNEAHKVVTLRKQLISEIFNSIKRRK